jgi:hypothetical protein
VNCRIRSRSASNSATRAASHARPDRTRRAPPGRPGLKPHKSLSQLRLFIASSQLIIQFGPFCEPGTDEKELATE